MLTFQQLLAKLTNFWADYDCIIHQGHDLEVGAGTFNPATFLRSLGPEPYATAYIEPSRRPQDARYGENPNRVHLFHQLQVIIKPSPLDIQKLYLDSLAHIGFDLSSHDIRFVHDDWESPTLGAWGLGWEVWMDGMEITQFTYFQSVGGQTLNPIPVELAYGLERIAMYIQEVDNIFDIRWNDHLTLGDISARNEFEWSHYNFSLANTEMWQRHFDDFEAEAKSLIEKGFPIPAYDFVMKASHAFNILESKGVISVTERTRYISRIRELAKLSAEGYVAMREKEGFPLIQHQEKQKVEPETEKPEKEDKYNPEGVLDFLLEIGSEELPASFVTPGIQSLERQVKKLLKDYGLKYKDFKTYATPRRLAVFISELEEGTSDVSVERKGPPIASAFDDTGQPSKQGAGFLKSLSLDHVTLKDVQEGKVETLFIKSVKNVDYLFVKQVEKGHSTKRILAENLPYVIENIHFPKKMRWSDLPILYARPLHWVVALLGKDVIPFSLGPIVSDKKSFGHSQIDNSSFSIKKPDEYVDTLRKHAVIVDIEERKHLIQEQLEKIETSLQAKSVQTSRVLSEVLYLSEYPKLTVGHFNTEFLTAPEEVLVSEMVEHQRYFPLKQNDSLLPQFVITADNTPNDVIIRGNEKVLSARLSDGVFLFHEDIKKPLDSYLEKLKTITFQKDLGSLFEKAERLEKHIEFLAPHFHIKNLDDAKKAARLCKADLATLLVGEFPQLQGVIGKHYATHSQQPSSVAQAIEEHYLPRFEADILPKTAIGLACSLSDKLDNLIGYFSVGLRPSSSSDPYALRRQTLGVIKILIESKISLDLKDLYANLFKHFTHNFKNTDFIKDLENFTANRMKTVYEEYGFKKDEIEACLELSSLNPYDHYLRLQALSKFRQTEEFSALYEVFKRAKGQLQGVPIQTLQGKLLKEPSEKELFAHIQSQEPTIMQALETKDYELAIKLLATFKQPLGKLYDEVKILSDEESVKNNRLALLQVVFALFGNLLDFTKLQEHTR